MDVCKLMRWYRNSMLTLVRMESTMGEVHTGKEASVAAGIERLGGERLDRPGFAFFHVDVRGRRHVAVLQMLAEALHTRSREDAEDVALVLVELGGCWAAETEYVISEEVLHACQAQVGQAVAPLKQCADTLQQC